jgi:hypothetical protein
VLLAVCVELIYVTVTRTWLRDHTSAGVERELAVTAFRAASMIVYWVMFRSFILQRTATHVKVLEPWIAIGLTPMLVVPLFFYGGFHRIPARGSSSPYQALLSLLGRRCCTAASCLTCSWVPLGEAGR